MHLTNEKCMLKKKKRLWQKKFVLLILGLKVWNQKKQQKFRQWWRKKTLIHQFSLTNNWKQKERNHRLNRRVSFLILVSDSFSVHTNVCLLVPQSTKKRKGDRVTKSVIFNGWTPGTSTRLSNFFMPTPVDEMLHFVHFSFFQLLAFLSTYQYAPQFHLLTMLHEIGKGESGWD